MAAKAFARLELVRQHTHAGCIAFRRHSAILSTLSGGAILLAASNFEHKYLSFFTNCAHGWGN